MKKYQSFFNLKIFSFSEVKFSIYLNRRVFVMLKTESRFLFFYVFFVSRGNLLDLVNFSKYLNRCVLVFWWWNVPNAPKGNENIICTMNMYIVRGDVPILFILLPIFVFGRVPMPKHPLFPLCFRLAQVVFVYITIDNLTSSGSIMTTWSSCDSQSCDRTNS